ncbi:hypothetical protein OPT61_g5397 [Boeremia exigua]|uniref:Uncharacterized protein n=1 Tax=Boeremia exigua TaxID=749465 RepID=A0ACC2IAK5_9PLEO|nr:hypothetical protein OPT61_g5397 [Boeremia exigua]
MPTRQQRQSNNNRHKFQRPEIHLVRLQLALESLCRLGQPKADAQINEQHREPERRVESLACRLERDATGAPNEETEQNDEDEKGNGLEHQACQQDVIWIRWVPAVGVGDSDQCGPYDLDHCRDDVARDEDPENQLGAERSVAGAVWGGADQDGEHCVNGGCEEDRCDDNKEVLDHEVGDAIRVAFCTESAGDVADDFLSGVSSPIAGFDIGEWYLSH